MDSLLLANVASSVAPAASSSPAVASAFLESAKTWIAYVGVLASALIVAWAGVRKALKDLAKADAATPTPAAIVGGTIMETTTLLMWSESNRDLTEKLDSAINAVNYNTEAVREMCREFSETRHQIERLRDSMERKT